MVGLMARTAETAWLSTEWFNERANRSQNLCSGRYDPEPLKALVDGFSYRSPGARANEDDFDRLYQTTGLPFVQRFRRDGGQLKRPRYVGAAPDEEDQ